ncbi:MAG: cyclic nucleotide-binding domain-containing protein [candidate division Zixibacteria bacterium]|nr:cyclic nucleotide-binding domain-containing protein [candidate division Zixibacteria bacterium]
MEKQIKILLKYVPIFAIIPEGLLVQLKNVIQQRTIPKGRNIFIKGAPANSFYIIKSGEIEIHNNDPNADKKTLLAAIGEGEFWGEISILEEMHYSATARTTSESVIYEISIEKFKNMIEKHPDLDVCFMGVLSEQLRRLDIHMIEDLQQRCKQFEQDKIELSALVGLFDKAVSISSHFVIAVDSNGQVIYFNNIAQTLFGDTNADFHDSTIDSVIIPISNVDIFEEIDLVLSNGNTWTGDVLVSSGSSKRLYIKMTAVRVINESNKSYNTLFIGRDVTETEEVDCQKTDCNQNITLI